MTTPKTTKKTKTHKRRLALPANLVKNLEDARKNIIDVQHKGVKEVEKLYNKVIEIDFVQKVRKHDVVKKATLAGTNITKEAQSRLKIFSKRFEKQLQQFRQLVPIASKSEVDQLNRKVNALSKKLDDLMGKRKTVKSA